MRLLICVIFLHFSNPRILPFVISLPTARTDQNFIKRLLDKLRFQILAQILRSNFNSTDKTIEDIYKISVVRYEKAGKKCFIIKILDHKDKNNKSISKEFLNDQSRFILYKICFFDSKISSVRLTFPIIPFNLNDPLNTTASERLKVRPRRKRALRNSRLCSRGSTRKRCGENDDFNDNIFAKKRLKLVNSLEIKKLENMLRHFEVLKSKQKFFDDIINGKSYRTKIDNLHRRLNDNEVLLTAYFDFFNRRSDKEAERISKNLGYYTLKKRLHSVFHKYYKKIRQVNLKNSVDATRIKNRFRKILNEYEKKIVKLYQKKQKRDQNLKVLKKKLQNDINKFNRLKISISKYIKKNKRKIDYNRNKLDDLTGFFVNRKKRSRNYANDCSTLNSKNAVMCFRKNYRMIRDYNSKEKQWNKSRRKRIDVKRIENNIERLKDERKNLINQLEELKEPSRSRYKLRRILAKLENKIKSKNEDQNKLSMNVRDKLLKADAALKTKKKKVPTATLR